MLTIRANKADRVKNKSSRNTNILLNSYRPLGPGRGLRGQGKGYQSATKVRVGEYIIIPENHTAYALIEERGPVGYICLFPLRQVTRVGGKYNHRQKHSPVSPYPLAATGRPRARDSAEGVRWSL